MGKIHKYLALIAASMAMAACDNDILPPNKPYRSRTRNNSFTLSRRDELKAKGLSEFVINGKIIIARNEREAQKRYKTRYGSKPEQK